jgi:hypothetical protein
MPDETLRMDGQNSSTTKKADRERTKEICGMQGKELCDKQTNNQSINQINK